MLGGKLGLSLVHGSAVAMAMRTAEWKRCPAWYLGSSKAWLLPRVPPLPPPGPSSVDFLFHFFSWGKQVEGLWLEWCRSHFCRAGRGRYACRSGLEGVGCAPRK